MFKVIKAPRKHYAEIFQSLEVKFSFCNLKDGVLHEQFAPVKCKDFLGDVLHAELNKTKFRIYNFEYDGATQQIDRDACRLLMYFPNEKERDLFKANIGKLINIESENGLDLYTDVHETDDPNVLYVEGHEFWLSTIWRISLYSFLLKVMCYKYKTEDWITELRKNGSTEAEHMNYYDQKNQFPALLQCLRHQWTPDIYVYKADVHNNNGVFTLLKRINVKAMKAAA